MKKLLGLVVLVAIIVVGVLLYRSGNASADNVADDVAKAADAHAADPAAIARGAYVAAAADCAACHTVPGTTAHFAGGYPLNTPFGAIVSTNITPDRTTGIGNWTERDFFRAVRHGKGAQGLLYPAMPYNAYVKLSDADMHDLWAYMRSVPAIDRPNTKNGLAFPYDIRAMMLGWNMLFFDNTPFNPASDQSAAWNRGAYLVEGAGHCASCHTPKNGLGGDKGGEALQGYTLQGWFAPEIAGNPHVGLGSWSNTDITSYLKTGANDRAVASGPMAEAVENSTQFLTDTDLDAIATYLKTVPGSNAVAPQAIAANDTHMSRGKTVYELNCAACHNTEGQGIEGMVPRFADSASLRSTGHGSLVQTVLKGGAVATTAGNPTGAGMPSFAWKLSDGDIADVLTYVRNSWGNAASAVDSADVARARSALHARSPLGATAAGSPPDAP